jgi:hypothetical protein
MVEQCKAWVDFKYRRRRITKVVNAASSNDNANGKAISQWVEPNPSPDDLFFAMPRNRKRRSSLRGLYVHMSEKFANTLDRIGFGNRGWQREQKGDNISFI